MADLHYFPMYASDWLAGEATTLMSCEQEGAFIRLLCVSWLSTDSIPCTIPADDESLAKLSKLGKRWAKVGGYVRAQFEEIDGRLRNPRLWQVYQEQLAKHEKRASAGRSGGIAKARRRKQSPSNAKAMLKQSQSNALAKGYQSESESESELETTKKDIPAARGWPADGAAFWGDKVAPVKPGHVGGVLKDAVDVHGWAKVRLGMEAYIIGTPDGRCNLKAFANSINHWISLGEECPRTPSGELSMNRPDGSYTRLGKIVHENLRRSA